jgi:hypothetical protein
MSLTRKSQEYCHRRRVYFHQHRCTIGLACAQAVAIRGVPHVARRHAAVPRALQLRDPNRSRRLRSQRPLRQKKDHFYLKRSLLPHKKNPFYHIPYRLGLSLRRLQPGPTLTCLFITVRVGPITKLHSPCDERLTHVVTLHELPDHSYTITSAAINTHTHTHTAGPFEKRSFVNPFKV